VVSFLSPCVLPIVPGYLSLVTGVSVPDIQQGRQLGTIARTTAMFIAGFSTVFILLGLSATVFGGWLIDNQGMLTRLSGMVLLLMVLFLLASLIIDAPWLYRETRFHPDLSRFGPFAAPVAGVAFGFGWTPCIGPVLTAVLAVAATQGEAVRGALLLAAYSLGLGLPFMAMGLAMGRAAGAMRWVKDHFKAITVASASMLAFFGLILVLDQLTWVTTQIQDALRSVGLDPLVDLG
jgi:cytochrome c-type biogenesis protein